MSFTMTKEEREAFLAALHVGVIAVEREGNVPLVVPIWYAYTPGGEVTIVTGQQSRKATLLTQARRFSLCVQDEASPYAYVTVEGPIVAIEAADREGDVRPMAQRYLGREGGDEYIARMSAQPGESGDDMLVRMRPERWLTADYGKEGA